MRLPARAARVAAGRMRRLLEPVRLDSVALALLALAAVSVLVAGAQHARLYHRGYAEVEIVGLLFLMNAIASTGVVLALIFGRAWLFVLGALAVCVPSLASIALSHSPIVFLGFREGGYDADALIVVVAELAAVGLAALGALAVLRASAYASGAAKAARR